MSNTNWFKDWEIQMYEEAIKEHSKMAHNEHLHALGSKNNLTATMHENNADMHRLFAKELQKRINKLVKEV